MRKSISALLPALLLTACAPPADRHPELPDGIWRAEVDHFGHILPFNFEVARDGEQLTVTYLNGPERMPVEQVRYDGSGRIELNFPSYSSRLTAKVDAGTMTGEITLLRANKTHQLPFRAEHGQSWRFFPEPADEYADFGGRWEVEIVVPRFDFKQPAIALFDQDGPYVSGTIMTQVGDYRYLYGEARGQDLYLSTFDGGGTQQWRATLDSAGELAGEFESATYGGAEWNARRNDEFRLLDPTTLTYLKPGYDTIDFSFPDLEGNLVSPGDARFDGQVLLVILGGSWCSTCHDEAQFMVPFYAEHHDRGLEVIYVMFEYSDRFEDVADQLYAFRDRYRIEHPILFAGDAARDSRGSLLPMLNNIVAFPTTLFVDRQGRVRRIHTAFPGPATGQEHEDYKREFRAFVDSLLREPA